MSNELSVVSAVFNNSSIRIIDHEGEPVFCFPDVCRAIDMQPEHAKRSLGISVEKSGVEIGPHSNQLIFEVADSRGLVRPTRFLDEDQTYQLVMVGRSELCKEFRKFAAKIIKQIRKEGVVDLRPQTPALPTTYLAALEALVQEVKAKEAAEAKSLEHSKRVEKLIHSPQTFTATQMAKELGLRSARQLNEYLVEDGFQYRCKTNKCFVPTAKYSTLGLHEMAQTEVRRSNGKLEVVYNMHFTPKGREWLIDNYKQEEVK